MLKSLCAVTLGALLIAEVAVAWSGGCVRLETERNYKVESKEGVQAIVRATATCGRDVNGRDVNFEVRALDSQGRVVGSAAGSFSSVTITSAGGGETEVFVRCDPEKFNKLEVEEVRY